MRQWTLPIKQDHKVNFNVNYVGLLSQMKLLYATYHFYSVKNSLKLKQEEISIL